METENVAETLDNNSTLQVGIKAAAAIALLATGAVLVGRKLKSKFDARKAEVVTPDETTD